MHDVRRRLPAVLMLALTTALLQACSERTPVGPATEAPGQAFSIVPWEYTDQHVMLFTDAIPADFEATVLAAGGTLRAAYPEIRVALVRGLSEEAAAAAAGGAGIATRDLTVQWLADPSAMLANMTTADPTGHPGNPASAFFFPCQWNLAQCNVPGAWSQGHVGDPGVKVAVLDTGTDPFQLDLAGQIDVAQSVSMLSGSPCGAVDVGTIFDFHFHGTFVSGLVAAKGIGISGVAPHSKVVGVKVLNCAGGGSFGDVIAGIMYSAGLGDVDVINMSLGAGFPKNLPGAGTLVAAMNNAVNYAGSQGKLVVSAAGNAALDMDKDRNIIIVPAQSGSGIATWAGDVNGNLAPYSNHGVSGTWVGAGGGAAIDPVPLLPGCVLPGFGQGGIISTCSSFVCGGTNVYLFNGTGTSFSAPLVAGVAALVDGKAGGSRNGGQLKTILANTADDLGKKGTDNLYSRGRVNAARAVQ